MTSQKTKRNPNQENDDASLTRKERKKFGARIKKGDCATLVRVGKKRKGGGKEEEDPATYEMWGDGQL